ncbi:MAG TPA: hypothetical protein VGJ84_07450, partial [Polyangiaceae bacterium]
MAKKRTKTQSRAIVVRERSPAPIIRVSAPRATPVKHKRRRKGGGGGASRSIGSATGSMSATKSGSLALGGFIYGYIEKNVPQVPTLPLIGKSGAIALIAYFMGGKNPGIIADIGNAASVIAG